MTASLQDVKKMHINILNWFSISIDLLLLQKIVSHTNSIQVICFFDVFCFLITTFFLMYNTFNIGFMAFHMLIRGFRAYTFTFFFFSVVKVVSC